VALETVRDPALLVGRVAAAIGLAESRKRPADIILREWLASKRVLLLLDNFEQVVAAGPIVADLLRDAPGLSALVTSRAALHVSGEQEYPVPGLPTPPDLSHLSSLELASLPAEARTVDPATLSAYESVRLFIARATAVRPDFLVTNENAPAVAAIAARLHGMPLAIELAAARIKLFSPDALRNRLEDQLALLSAGARDLPERQQTLRGAIAWSYDLLDEGQRRLLDRLSVFEGGIDLAAAEAVCGPGSEVGVDVVDGLVSLADQSLIRSVDTPGEPRFAVLDTIRAYAAQMLAQRGEEAAIRGRHAAWFLELAQAVAPKLAGIEQRELLDQLEREHDNIRAVLDRSAAVADAKTAIGLSFAVWRFWQKRGHLSEARRRLGAMAAAPWSHEDPILRARLMEALGGVCWWQADIKAMRPAYEEAADIWRRLDVKAELANALYNLSFVYAVPEDPATMTGPVDPGGEGERLQDEALALYRELGDARGEGNVLWGMGNKKYFSERPDAGVDEFMAALAKFRSVGDRTMEAWSLHMAGSALLRGGRQAEARPLLFEALRHFFNAGDAAGVTLVIDDLSALALADDDPERAARLWGAGRALTAASGATIAAFTDTYVEADLRPHVRQMVEPEDLERWAAEGGRMSLDEVVAYGLGIKLEDLPAQLAAQAD
jgi:predicted ATPase